MLKVIRKLGLLPEKNNGGPLEIAKPKGEVFKPQEEAATWESWAWMLIKMVTSDLKWVKVVIHQQEGTEEQRHLQHPFSRMKLERLAEPKVCHRCRGSIHFKRCHKLIDLVLEGKPLEKQTLKTSIKMHLTCQNITITKSFLELKNLEKNGLLKSVRASMGK